MNKKHILNACIAESMGGGSGGGGTGSIRWPDYLESYHRELLNVTDAAMDAATRFAGPNLVTNGRFDQQDGYPSDTWGWSFGTGWTVGSDVAQKAAGTASVLAQGLPYINLIEGEDYVLSYVLESCSAGNLTPYVGSTAGTPVTTTDLGLNTETITHAGPLGISFSADAAFAGSITSISISRAGTSAYDGEVVYDPDSDLTDAASGYTTYASLITALDPDADWEDYVDRAAAQYDVIADDDYIDAAVDAFEDNSVDALNRSINRFVGGMVDANAQAGSAFVMGLAQLEASNLRNTASFRASLGLQKEQTRQAFINQGVMMIFRGFQQELEFKADSAKLLAENMRQKIIFKTEESKENMAWSVKDALWDLDVLRYAGNTMAAPSGGVTPTPSDQPLRGTVQSVAAGTLTGAAAGAGIAMGMQEAGMLASGPVGWGIVGVSAILGALSGL